MPSAAEGTEAGDRTAEAAVRTAEGAVFTVAVGFMAAVDSMEAAGEDSAGDGGMAVAAGMAVELGGHMAAECNAAPGGDSADTRREDIAGMGARDLAEER